MSHQDIINYNLELIKCEDLYNLHDYIRYINSMYSDPNDISFMVDLMLLEEQDNCSVPHTMLIKYKIIEESVIFHVIKNKINEYNLVEGKDYRIEDSKESSNRGFIIKRTYYFHPTIFKMFLMSSISQRKYTKYYILLEKSIKYYQEYLTMYKDNIRNKNINNKDVLEMKIDELFNFSKGNDNKYYDIETELCNTCDKLDNVIIDVSHVQDKLEIPLEDRVLNSNDNKLNQIGILKSKNNDNVFFLTCGQKNNIERTIRLKSNNFNLIEVIDNVPNSIYIFDHIKKYLGSNVKINNRRTIELISISEDELIEKIKSIFTENYSLDLTKYP